MERWMVLGLALGLLGLLGGVAVAWWLPHGPLFAWWLGYALLVGSWLAGTSRAPNLGARFTSLLVFQGLLVGAGLLTTHLAARRLTSATHLRFEGVHFERVDSILVGSGQDGLDVVLPTVTAGQIPWHLAVISDSAGWFFTPRAAMEQVRVQPVEGRDKESGLAKVLRLPLRLFRPHTSYSVVNGLILDQPGDFAVVRDHRNRVLDTLRLVDDGGERAVERPDGGMYRLKPENPRLRSRYTRMLRFGTTIGSLDGPRPQPVPYDRFIRVQRIPAGQTVNGLVSGWGHWWRTVFGHRPRLLVSASSPFSLENGHGTSGGSVRLGDSVRVEVRHQGVRWRFDLLQSRREPTAELGLSVRFGRNPRPLDSPLPSGESCQPGVACGLLSLRRLPVPISHISLEGAGFDPARFGLLAQVVERDRGVKVVQATDTTWVPRSASGDRRLRAIPVTSLASETAARAAAGGPRGPGRWVLLSATGNVSDAVRPLLFIWGGIALLLLGLRGTLRTQSLRTYAPGAERYFPLGLNAVLTLLFARLIVGARVAFFDPYEARGLETAVGMWVAVGLVTFGLMRWNTWAPRFLKSGRELAVGRRQQWNRAVGALRAGVSHEARGASPFSLIALVLALVMLVFGVGSWEPVGLGAICGLGVLSAWFLIAWIEAFSRPQFHSFESDGPFEVIEYRAAATLPEGRLARLAPDWPLFTLPILWSMAVGSPLIGVLAAGVAGGFVIWQGGRHPSAWPHRNAWLLAGAYVASTFVLAALRGWSENGAFAAFILVILVALIGIRSGRILSVRLPDPGDRASPRSEERTPEMQKLLEVRTSRREVPPGAMGPLAVGVYLGLPVLLLLPLGLFDMGLLLVMILPIGAASVLAVGYRRLGRGWQFGTLAVAAVIVLFLWTKILRPDLRDFTSNDPSVHAERFEAMQGVAGIPLSVVGGALQRAAARAVAALDRGGAEELLLAARPGHARDQLLPAIEQAWGGKAYAAAGWMGVGLGAAPIGRGVAEAVSYAENSYAVYILHEHGVAGGMALISAYIAFLIAVLMLIAVTPPGTDSRRASEALFLVAALMITIPAAYVALSNLAIVPITGQNMPFLGLNAWSDVALCAGTVGILITGAVRMSDGPSSHRDIKWRTVVREKRLQLVLLGIAALLLGGVVVATVNVGTSGESGRDLTYDRVKDAIRSLIANRGPEGIATYRRGQIRWGKDAFEVDTLAVTGDSLLFPSLANGGFLRDQVERFNDAVTRRRILKVLGQGNPDETQDTRSLFQLTRTDSAFYRLSGRLNEYALLTRSPFSDHAWRMVRTADSRDGPAILGLRGNGALPINDSLSSVRMNLSGRECLVMDSKRPEAVSAPHLLYCSSRAGAEVGAAYDLSVRLRDSETFGGWAEVGVSRLERTWLNGVLARPPLTVGPGDLVFTSSIGPLTFSDIQEGVLASRQWINGKASFTTPREGTLSFFGRAGRAVTPRSQPLMLSLDAGFSGALQNEVDGFARANATYLDGMAVVVADLNTGEIRAIVESTRDRRSALRSFEPVLLGSMVKPILAAAILSRDPGLGNLEVDWAGPSVSQVAGVSVEPAFSNPLNGCPPRIGFDAFLRCSINQYAVELVFRALQRSAGTRDITRDGIIPTAVLENSPLDLGLYEVFGDQTLDVVDRLQPTGRTNWYWRIHPGLGTTTAPVAADVPRDATLYPWASRPWFIKADTPGTPAKWMARFAFGAWEDRWTLLGAAEAYARIATGRRIGLSFLPRPDEDGDFPQFGPEARRALGKVRHALRAVGETGTARGLAPVMERIGSPDSSLVLLTKTGTLSEVTARAEDDDVYVKSLAMAVGRPAGNDRSSPLTCGLVAITYFEFRQDWRTASETGPRARLPEFHRTFAATQLTPVLRDSWRRMGVCRSTN